MKCLLYGTIVLLRTKDQLFLSNEGFFNENLEKIQTDQFKNKFLDCLFIILPCIEKKNWILQKRMMEIMSYENELKNETGKKTNKNNLI